MPKKPARKEIGTNRVATAVNVFMMSFMRLLITERYISNAPLTRSRRLSLRTCNRTR